MSHNRMDDWLKAGSEYIAVGDEQLCSSCGICADRCVFEARTMENGVVKYNPDKCYGCGLCVTACPNDAIVLLRVEETLIYSDATNQPHNHREDT